jgi:hypothetical protein
MPQLDFFSYLVELKGLYILFVVLYLYNKLSVKSIFLKVFYRKKKLKAVGTPFFVVTRDILNFFSFKKFFSFSYSKFGFNK